MMIETEVMCTCKLVAGHILFSLFVSCVYRGDKVCSQPSFPLSAHGNEAENEAGNETENEAGNKAENEAGNVATR